MEGSSVSGPGAVNKFPPESVRMELDPDAEHCIETRARRAYDDLARRIMAGEELKSNDRQHAELLEDFIKQADFRRLRCESEEAILAGRKVRFVIYRDGCLVKCEMRT